MKYRPTNLPPWAYALFILVIFLVIIDVEPCEIILTVGFFALWFGISFLLSRLDDGKWGQRPLWKVAPVAFVLYTAPPLLSVLIVSQLEPIICGAY